MGMPTKAEAKKNKAIQAKQSAKNKEESLKPGMKGYAALNKKYHAENKRALESAITSIKDKYGDGMRERARIAKPAPKKTKKG